MGRAERVIVMVLLTGAMLFVLQGKLSGQQSGYFSNMAEKYNERGIGKQSGGMLDGNESISDYDGNKSESQT